MKSRNWLVIHQPAGEITVATMRVIDSWSGNQTRKEALAAMTANVNEYAIKHGEGRVSLIEQGPLSQAINTVHH
jgi:hypothetical protein